MSRILGFIHDRLAAAGHQVDYLGADDVPVSWQGPLGRRFGFSLFVRRVAVTAARQGQPYDIVNVHEPHSAPIAIWKKAAGVPAVVVTSHGLERRAWELAKAEGALGRGGPTWDTRLTYPLTRLWPAEAGLRRADHVFCLSAEDRDDLQRRLGRPRATVTRIYPAADEVYARASDARDYGRVKRILFAGVWRKNKGVEDLVPAFVELAGRHPAVQLSVVGAGVPEAAVHDRFPAFLRPRIVCETPGDEAAMAGAFAGADLFLLPSLFEGTPLTLMQAMMSGLPIVTTATCGMQDVITDGANGLLVPIRSPQAIGSALERLMADAALRERLGRAARGEALDRYTWNRVALPVRQVYEELCAHRVR